MVFRTVTSAYLPLYYVPTFLDISTPETGTLKVGLNPERRSGTRAPILPRQFWQTMNYPAPAMSTAFAITIYC